MLPWIYRKFITDTAWRKVAKPFAVKKELNQSVGIIGFTSWFSVRRTIEKSRLPNNSLR